MRPLARILEQHDKRDDQQKDDDPEGEIPEIRIHLDPMTSRTEPFGIVA